MHPKKYNQLKQEVEQLKKLPGQQRGESIKNYIDHVREQEGEEGLEKVKKTLKEMGFEMDNVEELRDMKWIPETYAHIFFVASARIFDWREKEVFELGKSMATLSSVSKIFVKFFLSTEKTLKEGVKNWNQNFSRGSLELKDFDKKKRKGSLVLKDFDTHPLACIHFQGFFSKMLELITGSKKIKIKEVKCMSQGDEYHEYRFEY